MSSATLFVWLCHGQQEGLLPSLSQALWGRVAVPLARACVRHGPTVVLSLTTLRSIPAPAFSPRPSAPGQARECVSASVFVLLSPVPPPQLLPTLSLGLSTRAASRGVTLLPPAQAQASPAAPPAPQMLASPGSDGGPSPPGR